MKKCCRNCRHRIIAVEARLNKDAYLGFDINEEDVCLIDALERCNAERDADGLLLTLESVCDGWEI